LFLDGVTVPNGPAKLEQATLGGGGVTTIAAGVGGSVQLTPDGSKMLFAQPAASGEGDVFWIDLANPVPVRLGGAGYPGLLSPDGASGLVFTDCTPTCRLQVVEMKSGKATPISANATAALWGPGSDVVALVSGEPGKPGAVSLAGIDGNGATEVLSSGELVRWVDAHRLLARRLGVAAPYSFQNGLYLFSWP
jgi:hypothetical protein